MIELEKSKSGALTLKYNNKYIHSKYDPVREGIKFAEGNIELLENHTVVLYGIGLGYHIQEISKRLNTDSILYVFDYNNKLIEYCKKVNGDIFNLDNVIIVEGNDINFFNKLSKALNEVNDILIHKSSLDTIQESHELLYNLINDFNIMRQYRKINTEIIKESEENYIYNMEKNYKHINCLINEIKDFKKPFIIVAAGPSLDNDLDVLKNNREKCIIISVGSALRSLIKKGIKPDVVVIIDTKSIVQKQFDNLDVNGIPLCFAATASRWAVDSYSGPKYIFNVKDGINKEIKTRGTVAVAAMDIAIQCNAKKIVLLGQDLAFLNKKSHTDSFEETYGFKDDYSEVLKMKKIKSVYGEMLKTTQGYITFKNKIESLIRENPKIEFINCSKGALIEGTHHMNFEDIM